MKTLEHLFVEELMDMYDSEQRIAKALPKLAKAATSAQLKEAFESHLRETEGHIQKLENVFQEIGEKPKAKKCDATIGILDECEKLAAEFKGASAINAALICAGQKIEHHETATYGCLAEWAELLGHEEAANLLNEILEEEKATDEKLTHLAQSGVNVEARGEEEEEEDTESRRERVIHHR